MKDLRPLIYILLIPFGIVSVLFVITLFALAISKQEPIKELFSMTGTIGDTLGGITTCLVSGLTLYYIITTFKDQSSINQHSRSSNNFSIYYDLLKKIEIRINNLEISYTYYDDGQKFTITKKGLDSINLLSQKIEIEFSDGPFKTKITDLDLEFLKESSAILGDFVFFTKIKIVLP